MLDPGPVVSTRDALIGRSPGDSFSQRFRKAILRALRTFIQGIAAAFPTAGAGGVVLSTGYWQTFGFSCVAAAITAVVSLLQNVASFLPTDPTQKS